MTFAGSPERVEARLVPEAGYEFDPFRVSGLPARLGRGSLHAVAARRRAPRACRADPRRAPPRRRARRRRLRRRADGLAAWREEDPRGADRGGRAPRAREPARGSVRAARLPRLRDPGPRRPPLPGRRAADPAFVAGRPRRRAAALLGCRPTARCCSSSAGSQGARGAERVGAGRVRDVGPRRPPPLAASATTRRCAAVWRARTTACCPGPTTSPPRSPQRDLVLARAGGSVWEVAAAGKPAVLVPSPNATADHQTKNARYFAAGGGGRRPRVGALPVFRSSSARCSTTPGAWPRWARRCSAPRGRTRPTQIAEELLALRLRAAPLVRRDRRSRALGLRAARARLGRRGGRLGPQRDAVPRARARGRDRRRRSRPSPRRPRAGRRSSRRAYPSFPGYEAGRAARGARLAAPGRSSSPARTERRPPPG